MSDEDVEELKWEISYELWMAAEKSEDPLAALHDRAVQELELVHRYSPAELDAVRPDPLLSETLKESYLEALDRAAHPRFGSRLKFPLKWRLLYHRPGTRAKKNKEIEPT